MSKKEIDVQAIIDELPEDNEGKKEVLFRDFLFLVPRRNAVCCFALQKPSGESPNLCAVRRSDPPVGADQIETGNAHQPVDDS